MKYLLGIAFLVSCNVAEIAGIGKNDLGDNFGHPTLNNELIHFFRFEGGSGDQVDDIGGATLVNATGITSITGKFGEAVYCNSGDASATALEATGVTLGDSSGVGNYAISFWVYPLTIPIAGEIYAIFSNGTSFEISLGDYAASHDDLDISINVNANINNVQNIIANSGQWYHIAINFFNGGDTRELYINGQLFTTSSGNSSISWGSTSFGICSYMGGGSEFDGDIDSLGIWKRTLTSSEIKDLYDGKSQLD